MESLLTTFREGGVGMVFILATDGLCCVTWVPVLIAALVLRSGSGRRGAIALAGMFLLGAMAPLPMGVLARMAGRAQVDAALQAASPEFADELRTVGYAEAAIPLWFGAMSAAALLLASLVPLILTARPESEGTEG